MKESTKEQINAVYETIENALRHANTLVSIAKLTDTPPKSVDKMFVALRDALFVGLNRNDMETVLPYIEKHTFPQPIGSHPTVAEGAVIRALGVCAAIAMRNANDGADRVWDDISRPIEETASPGRVSEYLESQGESVCELARDWTAVRMVLVHVAEDHRMLAWLAKEQMRVLEGFTEPATEWVTRKQLHDFMMKHSPSAAGKLKSLQRWPGFSEVIGKKDHVADYQKLLPWLKENKLEFPWPSQMSDWD